MDAPETSYADGLIISDRKPEAHNAMFPVHSIDNNWGKPNEYFSPTNGVDLHKAQKMEKRWMRWPYLMTYALVIAVISAVIGGLAAKAIVQNNNREDNLPPSSCSTGSGSSNPSGSPAPSPTQSIIAQTEAEKYCSGEGTAPQELRMDFPPEPYWLRCATDWLQDDMAPFFAENVTVCIEACNAFNVRFSGARCVGAGYQGFLSSREKANRTSKDAPVNCWLKTGSDGQQDSSNSGGQVLALCLKEDCS